MRANGQYDSEYKQTDSFWGWNPAKYVKKLEPYLTPNHKLALDIGAGEGKNSFFLSEKGINVHAVEVSLYAIKNLIKKSIELKEEGKEQDIDIFCCDGMEWMSYCPNYDLIVSYGMLHCLQSFNEIKKMIQLYKAKTNSKGLNVICTFLEGEPVPEIQKYLNPFFVKKEDILEIYKDWEILESEVEVIEHMHPTTKVMHKHTVLRMIARKKG